MFNADKIHCLLARIEYLSHLKINYLKIAQSRNNNIEVNDTYEINHMFKIILHLI